MRRSRKVALSIAAVAAIAAIITAVAAIRGASHSGGSVGSGNTAGAAVNSGGAAANGGGAAVNGGGAAVNGGGGNCVAAGAGAVANCVAPVDPSVGDYSAEHSILGTKPPTPPGPWPFTVLYDKIAGKNVGLVVRNSPNELGFHIGLALHAQTVWVDCLMTTAFNPEPGLNVGPKWYRVRWPNKDRSDAVMSSSPSDPAEGWAYVYYLRPNGTNGHVPNC